MRAELFLELIYRRKDIPVREDLTEAFLWALDNVPEKITVYHNNKSYKEYTKMYFFGGYSLIDIAETFGVSRSYVGETIKETLRILRNNFGNLFEIGLKAYLFKQESKNKEMLRAYNVLRRASYKDLTDLSSVYRAYRKGSLIKLRNKGRMGRKQYYEILDLLKKNGYSIEEGGMRK